MFKITCLQLGLVEENQLKEDTIWWQDSFSNALEKTKNAKSSKNKRKLGADSAESRNLSEPSLDDLFKATGGARLGMRARADQTGKWLRTESERNETFA